MSKGLDPTIVNPIIAGFVEDLITTRGGIPSTKPHEIATKPIVEYDDRMRINATDKFDVAVYIATISFYLTQDEAQAHKARGAIVLYMDTEVADKMFKVAGLQVPYDEDDESMMGLCGSICQLIADSFKDRLAQTGLPTLVLAAPLVYKNSIPEGVEFSKDQNEKQEICFYYLKHKALVVEWTMTEIPKK